MKKPSCAISLVAMLLVLAIIVTFLAESNDTRKIVFNFACKAIPKAGIELDRDHCVKGIAVFFEDPVICEEITGEKFFTEYKGEKFQLENPPKMQCLTEIAAEKNDPLLCDEVNGVLIAKTKIDCLYQVAAKNNNPKACDMIGEEEQSRMGMAMNKAGCMAQLKNFKP